MSARLVSKWVEEFHAKPALRSCSSSWPLRWGRHAGHATVCSRRVAYLVGMEEYVFGFPLVMMDVTREVMTASATSGEYKAPINQFARLRTYVDPDFKDVVRISVNSLWSHGFLDLDAEPMIVIGARHEGAATPSSRP